MTKAVILCNLGGPNSPAEVEPFLFNLFYDRAIIRLPNPLRFFLAKLISKKRLREARENYHLIGGYSPLFVNTKAQADALQEVLGNEYKVLISMRYAAPRSFEVLDELRAFKSLESIVILPLYPQFSTSTTLSSFHDLIEVFKNADLPEPKFSCCHAVHPLFITSWQKLLSESLSVHVGKTYRVLFSAHGIPEKFVTSGDPYPAHVEATVSAVMKAFDGVDYRLCYQSRVGPLKWIGPSIDQEINEAANDGVGVIVVPIAFVSEHSETLVELDIQYRDKALELGIPFYHRVPTPSTQPDYINCLAKMVSEAGQSKDQKCQSTKNWGTKCMNF